jgi:ribonuclease HI
MEKITIYTDGASRGNPGQASIGIAFLNEKGDVVKKHSEYLGDKISNNEAEYRAVIIALKKFKMIFGKEKAKEAEVEIKSDSELMVSQLNGLYKIMNENIGKLFLEVWNAKLDFNNVKFTKIPRGENSVSDGLANEALDQETSKKTLF